MSITLQTEYVVINCGERGGGCGMPFAVTRSFYDHIKATGEGWYCPRGHGRVFSGPTDKQKLKEAQVRETALQDQLRAATRDAETARSELLRVQSRIANGVCPCCNRTFGNVRAHMQSQHPDFALELPKGHSVTFRCSCSRTFETYKGLRIHQGQSRGDEWDQPDTRRWASHLTVV